MYLMAVQPAAWQSTSSSVTLLIYPGTCSKVVTQYRGVCRTVNLQLHAVDSVVR